MAQTYPLDPVIRIVAEEEPVRTMDKVLVALDVDSGRAVEKVDLGGATQLQKRGLWIFRKECKYVLISNDHDLRNEVEASVTGIQLRDFAKNWSLPLNVNYLLRCPQGNEVKLAEALGAGSHPGVALHDYIGKWVKEFGGSDPGNVIQNFYTKQRELERHLEVKANIELGLTFQATVHIEPRIQPREQLQVGPVHVPIRVQGDTVDQDLKFEARLSVDPQRKISAIIYRDHESNLDVLLKTEIQNYCLANVSLQSLYFSSPGKLEQDLTIHLNNVVRPYGRLLTFFSIHFMDLQKSHVQPEGFFETKKEVPYDVEESAPPVTIKNHVQMSLQDFGLYRRTGTVNLDSWIQESLEEIIGQVLFGKRYIDLLIGFDPLKEEIKQRLSVRAQSIGYSIKQLITIPDLEQYEWLENFRLEVEGPFETKTPRFPVRLGVVVVAKISHLRDVETYLNRRQDVPELMKDLILDQLRQALHSIEPERFYMQFSYCDPEDGISVEAELARVITASLKKTFKAEVISVVFKPLETDITDIWATLEKSEGDLEITFPSHSQMTENITYRATLRIDGIHPKGWPRFRTANKDLPNICKRLQEHVISQLGIYSNDELIFIDVAGLEKVNYHLNQVAKKFAQDEFGLVIRLNSLRREATVTEGLQKQLIEKRVKALAEVQGRIIDAILAGSPTQTIEELEEQGRILRTGLTAGTKATIANFNRTEEIQVRPLSQLPEPPSRRPALGRGAHSGNNGHKESE